MADDVDGERLGQERATVADRTSRQGTRTYVQFATRNGRIDIDMLYKISKTLGATFSP